ncbi:MAG: small subunit ribosomal protein S2 [Alphaproteobacteria bacterium]
MKDENQGLTKKEVLKMTRQYNKLNRAIGGIKDMGGVPSILFVIDSNKEAIAIQEAKKLNIPVVAILDTNSNPDGIDYPIPGNDDASRAIELYCGLVEKAILDGISESVVKSGVDIGESVEPSLSIEDKAILDEQSKDKGTVEKVIDPLVISSDKEVPSNGTVEPSILAATGELDSK